MRPRPVIAVTFLLVFIQLQVEAAPPPEPALLSDLVAEVAAENEEMTSYTSVSFSSDGTTLAAIGTRLVLRHLFSFKRQAELHLFDVEGEPSLRRMVAIGGLRGCYGADPDSVSDVLYVTVSRRGTIAVRSTRQEEPLATIEHRGFAPGQIALDWPQRLLTVATEPPGLPDAEFRAHVTLYDLTAAQPLAEFGMESAYVRGLAFSPDASRLAAVGQLYTKKLVAVQLDENTLPVEVEAPVSTGLLRGWDCTSQKLLHERQLPEHELWSVTFSPDGNSLAVGMLDCTKKVTQRIKFLDTELTFADCRGHIEWWDTSGAELRSTGRLELAPPPRKKRERLGNLRVESLRYSHDGKVLLTGMGSYNRGGKWGALRLVDPQTYTLKEVLLEKTPQIVLDARFSADGTKIAAAARGGELYLWDIDNEGR
jgi:WD40 repeat protein